jgi:hypothetical protein
VLHREFAIEPQSVCSWDRFRILIDACGISSGRLVSRFPKNWCKHVYEACKDGNCREVELKRIEEKLASMRATMLRPQRSYEHQKDWFENAYNSHKEHAFHCIVANTLPGPLPKCLSVADVHADNTTWRVQRDMIVERNATDLVTAAQVLLELSREVILVDPHYGPETRRYETCAHFFEAACKGKALRSFSVHLKSKSTSDFFVNEIRSKVLGKWSIPEDIPVFFIRWNEIASNADMHPRYVLTELGGIRYEHGLDARAGTNCDVSLIDNDVFEARRKEYSPASTPFKFADGVLIEGGKAYTVAVDRHGANFTSADEVRP